MTPLLDVTLMIPSGVLAKGSRKVVTRSRVPRFYTAESAIASHEGPAPIQFPPLLSLKVLQAFMSIGSFTESMRRILAS
jgi:hypothetical protein